MNATTGKGMRLTALCMVLLLGMVYMAFPAPAQAAGNTYYVSASTGSDANNGLSAGAPFATIQKAHDVSAPGDTILIMSGTYGQTSGQGVVEITRSGLPGAYITYKAYDPAHKPVLKVTTAWNHIRVTGASYIKIEDLIIEGNQDDITQQQAQAVYDHMIANNPTNTVDWDYVGTTNTNGIVIAGAGSQISHHVELRNLDVSKCPGGGIGSSVADYITFENNRVHDNSKWSIYGNSGISIYEPVDIDTNTSTYKNIIRNNVSYNNATTLPFYATQAMSDGNGIILDDFNFTQNPGTPYQGKTLVVNNIVYNNGGSGIHAYESTNVDIVNNTAYNNNQTDELDWGQIFANLSADVNITNNILYARTGYPVNANYSNTNVVYDYNVYYNGTPVVSGTHDIVANPNFVNAANGNFKLNANSPAIDAGTSTLAPATDYEGTARPQGNGVDIGAYETQSSGGGSGNTIFTTQTPAGYDNDARYELGTKFKANVAGKITHVKIYANAAEGGAHNVRIWNATSGALLAGPYSWTIASGTAGWKTYDIPDLSIAANTDYIVAVSNSTDMNYAATTGGFSSPINNGNLITYTGSGLFNTTLGNMPNTAFSNSNYFRDVVFQPGSTGATQHIFTTQTPSAYSNDSQYELGTKFKANVAGTITKIRIYAAANEGGVHTVRIWNANGTLVAGPYSWNITPGAAGWKVYNITDVPIAANTDYIVAVSNSTDMKYAISTGGFNSPINNGNLITYTGSGLFSTSLGSMPSTSYSNSNYFRDIEFQP